MNEIKTIPTFIPPVDFVQINPPTMQISNADFYSLISHILQLREPNYEMIAPLHEHQLYQPPSETTQYRMPHVQPMQVLLEEPNEGIGFLRAPIAQPEYNPQERGGAMPLQPEIPNDAPIPPIEGNPMPVPPEEIGNPDGVHQPPISWDQRILFFFLNQLQNALNLSLFSPPSRSDSEQATLAQKLAQSTDRRAERDIEQRQTRENPTSRGTTPSNPQQPISASSSNAAGTINSQRMDPTSQHNRNLLNAELMQQMTQTGALRSTPSTPPTSASENPKLLLAELALKLLSINQLSQTFVSGVRSAQQPLFSISSRQLTDRAIITQVGKLFTHIEQLKALLDPQTLASNNNFYRIVVDRLKEIADELRTEAQIASNPQNRLQKEAVLDRLNQEVEWLSILIATAKAEKETRQLETLKPALATSHPLVNPLLSKPEPLPTLNLGNLATPLNQDQLKSALSTSSSNLVYFLPVDGKTPLTLALQVPKTTLEMAGMIQAHLNKGVMQPLPIIVPYPIGITFNESHKQTSSSERGGVKKENNNGKPGFGGGKDLSQVMLLIPAGPVIIGDPFKEGRSDEQPTRIEQLDPFLIASTPVTNAQYADWLSDELLNKTIHIIHPGKIVDHSGRLLAMTVEGARTSQLELSSTGGVLAIRSTPGRENHPVVHVTYLGAQAFCRANGFRLPSEEEWERAAGMLPTEYGQPLKKRRYGCSAELLTSAWAPFRESGMAKITLNLTMPVGFFDGQKVYSRGNNRIETNHSMSPWGCSDMSGNVREWTSSQYDEDGLLQITKGGSYGDGVFDLRVAAKIPLPPTLSDPYTGFRVVI